MSIMSPRPVCLLILLLVRLPSSSSQLSPSSLLQQLAALESSISVSWRNNDRPTFRANVSTALATEIPNAVLSVTARVASSLGTVFAELPGRLKILSPIFTILSVVADILGLTLFSQNDQFADLYAYLERNFIQVNAMIEANFHAIKDLKSVVLCGQVTGNLRKHQTSVAGFFNRYKEMLQRAQTDRGQALAIFDTELPQYQSSKVLLELRQMLRDKTLYTKLLNDCARGDLIEYLKMMVELHHTFKQAIILDTAAKIRLFNLSKDTLDTDREFWRNQSSSIIKLMTEVGTDLVMTGWYRFYIDDINSKLSSSAEQSPSDAIGSVSSLLTQKYWYVRTAAIAIPYDTRSISITDAFGAAMQIVSADSFVCYRSRRAFGDTVIVFCRNVFVYPNEQADLDSAYAIYSRGVISLSLVDALRNDRWGDIGRIMSDYQVSFFAVRVVISLHSGAVASVQSDVASNLTFFQTDGTAFQALVIAKLIGGIPPKSPPSAGNNNNKLYAPTKVMSSGSLVTAHWCLAALPFSACFLVARYL